jgi:parallel beta-helix repeat protein
VVATSSTTTFYVSPSGNDAQPGSASQPWRTLQKAANTLEPGQTAIVRPGVYNEVLTVNRGGICGAARVSLLSETLHGAKFRRAVIKADYVTLDGFEIEEDTVDAGVSIQGSAYTVVSNCYIHDCPEYGISLRHLPNSNPLKLPSHFVLSGNRIEHNGQVGIRIKGSSGLVEGNTITRTVAYHPKAAGLVINGTDADGMHVFGDHHTIRNNTISNIGDPAENDITGTGAPHVDFFQSWDGSAHANPSEVIMSDCLIENNYCWSTHPSSKALIAESVGGTMGAHDLTIRNNIFEFRDAGIFLQQYTAGFPHRNISIYNNIFTAMLGDTSWGCGICMNGVVDCQVFNNIMVNCQPEVRQITGSGIIDYNFAWYSDGSTPRFTTPAPQAHGFDPVIPDTLTGEMVYT